MTKENIYGIIPMYQTIRCKETVRQEEYNAVLIC